MSGDLPGAQPLDGDFRRAAVAEDRRDDSGSAAGAGERSAAAGGHANDRDRRARSLGHDDGARARRRRRANAARRTGISSPMVGGRSTSTRSASGRPPTSSGTTSRRSRRWVGNCAAEGSPGVGIVGYDACCRPQRRRLRNSPFREMPSIRAASSTRPCVRSSACRTSVCSRAVDGCRQRLVERTRISGVGGRVGCRASCGATPGSPATAAPASASSPVRPARPCAGLRWRAGGCCRARSRAAGIRAFRR